MPINLRPTSLRYALNFVDFHLVFFVQPLLTQYDEYFSVKAKGHFGNWGPTDKCPAGSYVTRFRTRTHHGVIVVDKKGITG